MDEFSHGTWSPVRWYIEVSIVTNHLSIIFRAEPTISLFMWFDRSKQLTIHFQLFPFSDHFGIGLPDYMRLENVALHRDVGKSQERGSRIWK